MDLSLTKPEGCHFKDFGDFQLVRVLQDQPERRMIVLEGRFPSQNPDTPAVVILNKTPFNKTSIDSVLNSEAKLQLEFQNDSYGKYNCLIKPEMNLVKADLIFPATQKHIDKYTASPLRIINETETLYQVVTKPFLASSKFSIDWVYNILDHEKEADTIVYEDPDPETGFILLPDFKWNGKQVEDLYLLCILHNRNIASLRDVTAKHLGMLRNIWRRCTEAIKSKYGVDPSQIRAYFHYQPSYYHLHIHFTHVQYEAPGIKVEKAHLLPSVISNLEKDFNFYRRATLPFVCKESDKLFQHYKDSGYPFETLRASKVEVGKMLSFFTKLGAAKHEPCGEHWDNSYGDSAWRMAIMAMCLPSHVDRMRLVKIALSSAFTSVGKCTDHSSQWPEKLQEVRQCLFDHLPFEKAQQLFSFYSTHVNARRGVDLISPDDWTYRKLIELEELLLQWEELRKEGQALSADGLLKTMGQIGFAGSFKFKAFHQKSELENLLKFFFQVSRLCSLKRTGWVRSGIRDPERVSGHMFRMAMMALVLEEEEEEPGPTSSDLAKGSAVVISLVHDMAECIVGDITPKDGVADADKHQMEMKAMKQLVSLVADENGHIFYEAFNRYENCSPQDPAAVLTKDLDKFDMILQAYEYEQIQKDKPFFLQEFFDSTKDVFRTEQVKTWVQGLEQWRSGTNNGVK